MDTTTSIAIENLSRTHLLSQISKINSMTAPPPVAALSPPTSTPVAKPSLILENGGPTSQPLSETFPRYSAFEKVVQSSSRKNDPTTEAAQHCVAQKSAASDPNVFSATTVEVLTKRKLENDKTEDEDEISNNSSTTKKSKNNDEIISTDNNNQQFSMRLPPTAKSGLCQQRAREQLVFQKKENKQKKLFDPTIAVTVKHYGPTRKIYRPISSRYPLPEKPRQKRAVIQDMVRPLKKWLLRHRHNPYPTKAEKVQLALGSNMTLVQVSNWFANARRRLKNVVQENHCSWSKRLRMYNQFVQGNAELLSISSNDSIWNSDDETEETSNAAPRNNPNCNSERSTEAENRDSAQFKKSILQRYLNDSVESIMNSNTSQTAEKNYNPPSSSSSAVAAIITSSSGNGSNPAAPAANSIIEESLSKSSANSSSSSTTKVAETLLMPSIYTTSLVPPPPPPTSTNEINSPKLCWPPPPPVVPHLPGMFPWLPMPPLVQHYLHSNGHWLPPPPPPPPSGLLPYGISPMMSSDWTKLNDPLLFSVPKS